MSSFTCPSLQSSSDITPKFERIVPEKMDFKAKRFLNSTFGGDTLDVAWLVPEPGQGCLAVVPDYCHVLSTVSFRPIASM